MPVEDVAAEWLVRFLRLPGRRHEADPISGLTPGTVYAFQARAIVKSAYVTP
jgi:hypothetical protein